MVFHVKRMLERNEENFGFKGGLIEFFSKGGLLGNYINHSLFKENYHTINTRTLFSQFFFNNNKIMKSE